MLTTKIKSERKAADWQTDLSNCVGFSIENQGNSICHFGDKEENAFNIELSPGTAREFRTSECAPLKQMLQGRFSPDPEFTGSQQINSILIVKTVLVRTTT